MRANQGEGEKEKENLQTTNFPIRNSRICLKHAIGECLFSRSSHYKVYLYHTQIPNRINCKISKKMC